MSPVEINALETYSELALHLRFTTLAWYRHCTGMGCYNSWWLQQSLAAISGIRSSLYPAWKQLHSQVNMCCVKALPFIGLCVCTQISQVVTQQCVTDCKHSWNYHFTVIKNHTTSNSMQAWVSKTINHHSKHPGFIAGRRQSQSVAYRAKNCEQMLLHTPLYLNDCTAVWSLTHHLMWSEGWPPKEQDTEFALTRDKVTVWVSEHSMQNNSIAALWANIADIYRRNFADTTQRQHCHIGRYILVCRYIGRALDLICLWMQYLIQSCGEFIWKTWKSFFIQFLHSRPSWL